MNTIRKKIWDVAAMATVVQRDAGPDDYVFVKMAVPYDTTDARARDCANFFRRALITDADDRLLLPPGWAVKISFAGIAGQYLCMEFENKLLEARVTIDLLALESGDPFPKDLWEAFNERTH